MELLVIAVLAGAALQSILKLALLPLRWRIPLCAVAVLPALIWHDRLPGSSELLATLCLGVVLQELLTLVVGWKLLDEKQQKSWRSVVLLPSILLIPGSFYLEIFCFNYLVGWNFGLTAALLAAVGAAVLLGGSVLARKLLPRRDDRIGALLGAMSCYYTVYAIVGLFATRHFAPAKRRHRYAIVIAARNEEAVIGRLLESIRLQDYPSELLTVFVVADNCTDGTAQAARSGGAVCYERCDPDHRTKGYALEYLFSCIARDYGTDAFEGYFVFDADNLLNRDYVSRMNEAFDAGERIVTSCRASKNFGDNWISASYALHWLRTVRMEHRARSVFGLATRIQGTGFLFASELVKNGGPRLYGRRRRCRLSHLLLRCSRVL